MLADYLVRNLGKLKSRHGIREGKEATRIQSIKVSVLNNGEGVKLL